MKEYQDRRVIIAGATGGLGKTVTRRWLEEGAKILAVARSESGLNELRDQLVSSDSEREDRLHVFTADATSPAGAEQMAAEAERVFGGSADTLLHLVGSFGMAAFDSPESPVIWERMIQANLHSAFHCYRSVLPGMRQQKRGWIVGISSRAAVTPGAEVAGYAASKAGLIALTQSLSAEVKEQGIHVNVILTSTLDTPANREAMGESSSAQWVSPEDLAEATLYLCSPRAKAVHGATMEVYGTV